MKKEATPNPQLRAARRKKCWTMAKAAENIGVSYEAYSRWEYGWQDPHLESLSMLCEAFTMTPEELGFGRLLQTSAQPEGNKEPTSQQAIVLLSPEQVTTLLALLGDETVKPFDPTKRSTLEGIAAILGAVATAPMALANPEPWERLAAAIQKPSIVDAHTLNHFEQLLETCRGLSNGSELTLAEQLLATFLPRLRQIAPYQAEAAGLAAQGLQLNSILAAHRLQISEKVALCEKAVEHARQANNESILVGALLEFAVALQYIKQPIKALQVYQEALLHSEQVSPVLQARTYAEAGAAFAKCGRKREALFYLGLAYDTLPSHPEQDANFAISDYCGPYTLSLYDGLIHLDLGNAGAAWNGFETFQQAPSSVQVPERIRLEIVNHQGRAAILENDLDKYVFCLKESVTGAIALKSKKRFDEAYTIFRQDVPSTWRKEPQIRAIAEQYQLN